MPAVPTLPVWANNAGEFIRRYSPNVCNGPSVGGVSVGRGRVRRSGAPVPTLPVVGAHPPRMGE